MDQPQPALVDHHVVAPTQQRELVKIRRSPF